MLKNAFRRRESLLVSESANSVIVNFHKKRSVPKEIPSEVEVSVVKMIVITWDDCIYSQLHQYMYQMSRSFIDLCSRSLGCYFKQVLLQIHLAN